MSKKFKDIKKGDTLYCVNPSWESDKCTITKWTVTDVYDAVSKDELIFDVKENPTPTFALREATSVFDLVFTSEEDARCREKALQFSPEQKDRALEYVQLMNWLTYSVMSNRISYVKKVLNPRNISFIYSFIINFATQTSYQYEEETYLFRRTLPLSV